MLVLYFSSVQKDSSYYKDQQNVSPSYFKEGNVRVQSHMNVQRTFHIVAIFSKYVLNI